MKSSTDGLGAHVQAALWAALLLALCQIAVESVLIAAFTRSYVLSPQVFFGAQMYDFCVKLFLALPGTGDWFRGATVDGFLPVGFASKLGAGGSLVIPNLVVAVALGALLGVGRWLAGRRASVLAALWILVAVGFAVHLLSWVLTIYVPKGWSPMVLVRHAGRVLLWEGAWISFVSLALAAPLALVLGRLRPAARGGAAGVLGAALIAAIVSQAPRHADSSIAPAPPLAAAQRQAENLILISIDSLRADRLSSYGNRNQTSPTIDRLAAEGVRFENASSASSWTLPSHMSMFTGRDVLGHGVISESDRLSTAIPTLAGTLKNAGLVTGAVVSTPVLSRKFGFDHGFDHYDDYTIPAPTAFDAVVDEPAPTVEKLATEWLTAHAGERFFLFLHFWDVHYDYIPPPPYDTMFDPDYQGTVTGKAFYEDKNINKKLPARDVEHLLALYDGEIRWVDDHIARLLGVLDRLGLSDKTAIVITSDHGDEFFEHGYKGHGRTLYNEVTRVPMVVRGPGVPAGQVVEAPVGLADIMPTALRLLGVEGPADLQGLDMLDLAAGSPLQQRSAVHGWLCHLKQRTNCVAMQSGGAGTLIHAFQPLRLEFYRPDDVRQQKNVAAAGDWPREEQMSLLEQRLNHAWGTYRKLGEQRGGVELDEATRDRLRDLGYVD